MVTPAIAVALHYWISLLISVDRRLGSNTPATALMHSAGSQLSRAVVVQGPGEADYCRGGTREVFSRMGAIGFDIAKAMARYAIAQEKEMAGVRLPSGSQTIGMP